MGYRQRTVKFVRMLGVGLALGMNLFAAAEPEESEVKAAFIYNFAKFVEWPAEVFESSSAPLKLCVLGHDSVETELRQLEGREAQGHTLRVQAIASPDDARECHILFIAASEVSRQVQIIQGVGSVAVLTVADRRDFTQKGGMIGLYVESQRVQFAVNLAVAQSRGLKLSARLLQLARVPR